MYKVLGLIKLPDTDPQEYELRLHDSENTKPGYFQTTEYGTETEMRAMLRQGGMPQSNIDILFAQASRE